ncbi:hypothetical protein BH09MYX1_BH09MYX1_54120 [soil metagenome]
MTDSIELDEATCRIITSRNLAVALWRDAPAIGQVTAVGRVGRGLRLKYQNGTVLTNVIVSGKANFSEEVRDEVARLYEANHYALGACHAVLVGGLAGVATRAFLGTMSLLRRSQTPSRVVGDLDMAARWVHERAIAGGEVWQVAEVRRFFDRAMAPRQTNQQVR